MQNMQEISSADWT